MMQTRELGQSGLKVGAIGLGCMGMSQSYGPPDAEESVRTIQRALDLGVTLIDTADAYGKGDNERLVGRAISGRRRDVVVATKFGLVPNASGPATNVDARPERVRACCEASLERLGIDAIDLYYLHRVDPNVAIEETVGAMAELVREGKVRFLGLSEAGPENLRRAHATHPIAALQSEYSLWTREPEVRVLPVCRELGIAFVPFSPLGRGFLSGAVKETATLAADDMRRRLPRFQGDNFERNLILVERLEAMATRTHCTPAQLALAWLLAKGSAGGSAIVPIPGTKRQKYLEENVGAATIDLSAADVSELEAMCPPDAAAGPRYNESMARLIDTGP
jgi:aryl-alcohol dehydrogenase-like predicted oxidoreductase